jgi:hypothetical protein
LSFVENLRRGYSRTFLLMILYDRFVAPRHADA